MSTLDIGGAVSDMTNPKFLAQIGAIVVGSMASTVSTEFMRANVMDLNVTGGDAVYSLVTALGILVFGRGHYLGRALALGSASTAGSVLLEQFGVV